MRCFSKKFTYYVHNVLKNRLISIVIPTSIVQKYMSISKKYANNSLTKSESIKSKLFFSK